MKDKHFSCGCVLKYVPVPDDELGIGHVWRPERCDKHRWDYIGSKYFDLLSKMPFVFGPWPEYLAIM